MTVLIKIRHPELVSGSGRLKDTGRGLLILERPIINFQTHIGGLVGNIVHLINHTTTHSHIDCSEEQRTGMNDIQHYELLIIH